MMGKLQFTIFTPTFNRRDLIGRVYESLCAQTFRDFEWLIVDDGSTDDTAARVRGWQSSASFPIRYVYQDNQGKHHAHNRGIALAAGELCAVLDSDDALAPVALERLLFHWSQIPESRRSGYSGVTCLCMDEDSKVLGPPLPSDVLDCRHYEVGARFGSTGEKWGFHRTEVLREFPFPEIPGERHCPDGLLWNRIARKYLMRHINEALRVYLPGAMSAGQPGTMIRNPRYARLYYQECLALDLPIGMKGKRAINYIRYSLHAGQPFLGMNSAAPVLTAAMALPAIAFYAMDRLRQAA